MTNWDDFYPAPVSAPGKTEHRTLALLDTPAAAKPGPVRRLEGLACPFGTWTWTGGYWERIMSTAFSDVIAAQSPLPLLLQHDHERWPVGVAESWTARTDGLHGLWRLDTDDPAATEALRKVEDGYVSGLSIGFIGDAETDELEVDEAGELRVTRWRLRLLEVSIVSVPAYDAARITAVRAAVTTSTSRTPALDQWRAEAARFRGQTHGR